MPRCWILISSPSMRNASPSKNTEGGHLLFGDVELASDDLGHLQSTFRTRQHGCEAVESLANRGAHQHPSVSTIHPTKHHQWRHQAQYSKRLFCVKSLSSLLRADFVKRPKPPTSWKTCCAVADEVPSKFSLIRSHHFSRSLWDHGKGGSGKQLLVLFSKGATFQHSRCEKKQDPESL